MMHWVSELSGEVPVDVGNGPETIVSRHKYASGNVLAEGYLVRKLEEFGYDPVVQAFSGTGNNILAVRTGVVHPEEAVILCAHFDAMPGGHMAAPGADDNGSGCAAVLEAARLFRDIEFAYTVVFAFWDEEEQGLVGSRHYAAGMAANDAVIRGVVNMDMIAYDGNGDTKARIHVRPVASSSELADSLFAVRSHYDIGLDLVRTEPGAGYSDHASFWNEGYGAILVMEEFGADGNPFYHTPNDRISHFDVSYYEKLAKLSVATVATVAEPVGVVQGIGATELSFMLQAWPNPSSMATTIWLDMPVAGEVRLDILDAMGREVLRLHGGTLAQGRHAFDVPLMDVPAGTYLVIVRGAGLMPGTLRVVRVP